MTNRPITSRCSTQRSSSANISNDLHTFDLTRQRRELLQPALLRPRPYFPGNPPMARRVKKPATDLVESLPPLPLDADHWHAIFEAMRLPPQHRRVVDLALRGYETKQIATLMGIGEATIKTYLQRIFTRTGTRGRMQLAMHVLAVSHQVNGNGPCRPSG